MSWKISIFFYLSLGFSLIGFIFPTHVSQALGLGGSHGGDFIHWVYGVYIFIPRNPVGEPTLGFNFRGYFVMFSAISLLVVSFIELRNAQLGRGYDKNLIYIIAILQLTVIQFFQSGGINVKTLSSWGFIYNAIFASMGNKELKLFYVDKGIASAKKAVSFILKINGIYIFLYYIIPSIPSDPVAYSSLFITEMLPALILYLVILIYGIYSLIRAIRKN